MPRKSPVLCLCEHCGEQFQTLDWRPTRPRQYCSRQCHNLAQATRVTLVCCQCQRPFERKAYMQNWSKERGPFCGFACYGQWQREHTSGAENPNFVAQSSHRAAGQWERNRRAALERDQFQCGRCGATKRLHVHHKIHWEPGQHDPHALDNLETLCISCHRKQHPVPQGSDGRFVRSK